MRMPLTTEEIKLLSERAQALTVQLNIAHSNDDITGWQVIRSARRGLLWTIHTDPELPNARDLSTGQMERFLKELTGR